MYICDIYSKLTLHEYIISFTEKPSIWTALSEMKVMKTTQSAFKNFVSDEFRTLPDADDRLFCTIVQCKWWYNTSAVNFERAW